MTVPQIKQIAGRAGRYRTSNQVTKKNETSTDKVSPGLVTTLNDEDLPIVRDALNSEAPPIKVAGLLPPGDYMENLSARLPKGAPFEYVLSRVCESATIHKRFRMCSIRDQSRIARVIESVQGLTVLERYTITAAPAAFSSSATSNTNTVLVALARCVAEQKKVSVVDIAEIDLEVLEKPVSGDRDYLGALEDLHKSLILFLWLSYRFVGVFKDRPMATYAKEMTEDKINTCLIEFSANPALRERVLAYKKNITGSGASTVDGSTVPGLDATLSASQNPVLPVDWTRGSSSVEMQDATPEHDAVSTPA